MQLSDFRAASQELAVNDVCLVIDRVRDTKNLEIYRIVEIKVDTDRQSSEVTLCRIEAARVTNQQPFIHPFPVSKNTTEPHFLTRDPKRLVLLIKANAHETDFLFFEFNYVRDTFNTEVSMDNLIQDYRVKNKENYIAIDNLPDSEKYIELPEYLKELPALEDKDYPSVSPPKRERLKKLEQIEKDRKQKRTLLAEKIRLEKENAKLQLEIVKTKNKQLISVKDQENKTNNKEEEKEANNTNNDQNLQRLIKMIKKRIHKKISETCLKRRRFITKTRLLLNHHSNICLK